MSLLYARAPPSEASVQLCYDISIRGYSRGKTDCDRRSLSVFVLTAIAKTQREYGSDQQR